MTIEWQAEVVWERSNRFATQLNLCAAHDLIVGFDENSRECRVRLRQDRDPLDGFERHVAAKRHVFAVFANPHDAILHWTLCFSHDSVSQFPFPDSAALAQQPGPADVVATR